MLLAEIVTFMTLLGIGKVVVGAAAILTGGWGIKKGIDTIKGN